ncbi:GNAT family N-acetyltransferase [Glaesserella sp.]|uniref:GNAT family N-acetyltransferase n=1 Tax=Glaesserella sp. TaxID=2094731 RepID=UPI00359F7FD0
MQKLPAIIAVTSDIMLEKIALRHSQALFEQIVRHRDYLAQFVNWTPFTQKIEDAVNFVKASEQDAEQGISYVWAICYRNNPVGTLSLNKPIDWQNRTVYLGYWLSPDVQGKGIVTQSIQRVMEEIHPIFDHYFLKCAVHNQRSNAVAKRCCFQLVERVENAEKIGDTWYAQNLYRKG